MTGSAPLSSSALAVDARGTVLTRDVEGGTHLVVRVKRLPPASRAAPSATMYVVWARANERARPTRLGALTLDGQDGELDTATPLRVFELFITAEPNAETVSPWGETVLWSVVR